MFAIPGIIALVVFIYARPQEFLERLRVVPLLYLFFGLAILTGLDLAFVALVNLGIIVSVFFFYARWKLG